MEVKPDDVTKVGSLCRACMATSTRMFELFTIQKEDSPNIPAMISCCTSVKIAENDGLPKQVCIECYNKFLDFYQYLKHVESIDFTLRAMLVQDFKQDLKEVNVADVKIENLELNTDTAFDSFDDNTLEAEFEEIKKENAEEFAENKKKVLRKYTCKICLQEIDKLKQLRKHYKISHPEAKVPKKLEIICEICNKLFKNNYHLDRHKMTHIKTDNPFRCPNCDQTFKREYLLLYHISEQHTNKQEIKPALQEINKKENLKCEECNTNYESIQSLAAHKKKHTKKGRILSCSVCSKVFKKTSHLKRHEMTHEVNRPYKCVLCLKSFVTEHSLFIHMEQHKGKDTMSFCCPVCSKKFTYKSTLNAHLRIHTGDRPFLCPTCGKRFDSSTNLKQHIRRHNGVKPFECDMCPKKFSSKGELNSHMTTHTGFKGYTCDQCGSSFTKSASLNKHKQRHLGIKPHQCDVCPMKFNNKDHLKRHYRIHTGEKPYQCTICERAFTQNNDLIKHKRSHLGDNLYKCDQCPKSFRLKTELTRHLSEHFVISKSNTVSADDRSMAPLASDEEGELMIDDKETQNE